MENLLVLAAFLALGLITLVLMEWRERKRRKSKSGETGTSSRSSQSSLSSQSGLANPSEPPLTSSSPLVRVPVDAECCGRHLVCERESLLSVKPEIVYYDDEELDRLAGVSPDNYSEQDLTDLNDVFTTLQSHEVAGWLRSLQLRNITLPDSLREEALMIVTERRFATSTTTAPTPAQD